MFVKLALNTITVLTLAVGLISCDRNEQVNSELGREENSAVNTSSTATGVAKEADVKVSQQQLYADGLGEKGDRCTDLSENVGC